MSKHDKTPRRPDVVKTGTGQSYGNGPKPNIVIERDPNGRGRSVLWHVFVGKHRKK